MQALVIRVVIRISRDVYVFDITVNFMVNKRKSKKAAGASPHTPLLPPEGARHLPYGRMCTLYTRLSDIDFASFSEAPPQKLFDLTGNALQFFYLGYV